MFKNILVPTDGSKLAAKGIKVGVRLAKALGAQRPAAGQRDQPRPRPFQDSGGGDAIDRSIFRE